jgi:hypothetical protein
MSSFYGNNNTTPTGGITPGEVETKVVDAKNHIIFSKIEPTVQKAGDIWVVIGEFADKKTTSTEGENNG